LGDWHQILPTPPHVSPMEAVITFITVNSQLLTLLCAAFHRPSYFFPSFQEKTAPPGIEPRTSDTEAVIHAAAPSRRRKKLGFKPLGLGDWHQILPTPSHVSPMKAAVD